jgi:hypothetical protein
VDCAYQKITGDVVGDWASGTKQPAPRFGRYSGLVMVTGRTEIEAA